MTRTAIPVPSLIQGVSQQPPALRFASQAELQENAFPSIADGLIKRHPFDHVAQLFSTNVGDPLVHFINRDPVERYSVLVDHLSVRVFDLAGVEWPVKGPTTPFTPDFSYLSLANPVANPVTNPEDFLTTWTVGATAQGPSAGVIGGPYSFTSAGPKTLGTVAGGVSNGTYTQNQGAFVAVQTFSLFVHANVLGTSFAANGVRLAIKDTSNNVDHAVLFPIDTALGVISVGAATGAGVGSVVRWGGGWYRISITVALGTAGTGATTTSSSRQLRIECAEFNATFAKQFKAWGARLDAGARATDYVLKASENTKAATIADYTFVLNKGVVAAMNSTVSPADPGALAVTPFSKGFVWVRAGNYLTNYKIELQKAGGAIFTVTAATWNGTALDTGFPAGTQLPAGTSTGTIQGTIKTDDIAQDLVDQIRSRTNLQSFSGRDYSANGVLADGWDATRSGSVVRIFRTNATLIDHIKATDSRGDTNLVKVWKSVLDTLNLPAICDDGYAIKVDGGTISSIDDAYIIFKADVAGAFGSGKWTEGPGFGINLQLDPATMPWQLTRQQDDGAGTVTGTAFKKYFQWAPVAWNARTVGDNTTAPLPSFVGQKLNDLFFHENRLGVLAKSNVILSEEGRYFNFFRTTLLTLPDSDPIDIAVPHKSVVTMIHAVPYNTKLFLFSDFTQFVLTGDPILTPKTVAVKPVLEFNVQRVCAPIVSARGAYFLDRRGDFSGLREVIAEQNVDNFYADDVSKQAPEYMPGLGIQMAVSEHESVLFILMDGDKGSLYQYKYHFEGPQQMQSAWSRYVFDQDQRFLGFTFVDSIFYALIQTVDGVYLLSSTIVSGRVDSNAGYITHLDRRFQAGPDTLIQGVNTGGGAGTTKWSLPYNIPPGSIASVQVCTRTTGAYALGGRTFVATVDQTVSPQTVTVPGNLSSIPVWIGLKYVQRYRFTKPRLNVAGSQGKVTVLNGRIQVMRGTLNFAKSGYFRVEVTPTGRATATAELLPINTNLLPLVLSSGGAVVGSGFLFPIYAKADEAQIDLVNDSPLPGDVESAEWEAEYVTKQSLFRG